MSGIPLSFTIRDHRTEHHHYDLMLDVNGAPMFWILPRGIPKEEGERRLAVEDNDGQIKPGGIVEDGYGVGKAEVWDSGTYEIKKKTRSKIEFEAKGKRLFGRFILLLPSWGRWCRKRVWVLIRL